MKFPITKGEQFFRTIFLEHDPVSDLGDTVSRDQYIKRVLENRTKADKTFLTFESFESELQDRIFQLPRIAFIIAIIGLTLGLATLILPGIAGWTTELRTKQAQVSVLDDRMHDIENAIQTAAAINVLITERATQLETRIVKLEAMLQDLTKEQTAE